MRTLLTISTYLFQVMLSTWIVCRDSWLPLWFPSRIPASSILPVKTAFLGWYWIPGGMSCFGDHALISFNLGISVSWTLNKVVKIQPLQIKPWFYFFISFYMCSAPGSPVWLFTECISRKGWAFFFNCSVGEISDTEKNSKSMNVSAKWKELTL